ncbi:hypothetical protein C1A38_13675 [Verrucosispora sp. ts21]|nr:hypothetical protein C1A38_13675 [Verrucosispora sp. ts21]
MNLPAGLRADVEWHLAEFAEGGPNGRLFRGSHRGFPRRRNFNRIWRKALTVTGIPAGLGLHLHDLRHTGST